MRRIPDKLKRELKDDPYYKTCARFKEKTCKGRITFEHAFIYAGRQINEKWAIIPLCEYHHAVGLYQDNGDLNKELNQMLALRRATDEDLLKYPKKDWAQVLKYLTNLHAKY